MDKALNESPLQFPFYSILRLFRTSAESVGQVVAEACCPTTKAVVSRRKENSAFIAEVFTNQKRGSN